MEAELKIPNRRGIKARLDERIQALVRAHAPVGAASPTRTQTKKIKTGFNSSLPAVIRKGLLGKRQKGVDIMWLTAVLNMEDKLNVMFANLSGHPNDSNVNLGLKYAASGANIWSNDYVKEKALAAAQAAAPEKPIVDLF